MPIHLTASDRRGFLASLGAGIVVCSSQVSAGENGSDDDLVYLLNDTHVGEKHPTDSPIPSHLRQVVGKIVNRDRPPAAVLINGDLALLDGKPGDYRHFEKLIGPLRKANINVHLTMGNHDHRDTFYQVIKSEQPAMSVVKSKHISVVQTRFANFFLLDSLSKTMVTQGTLGERQLKWLAKALDRFAEKPAIIVAHHNPRLGGEPKHFPGGLTDSAGLWKLLVSRPHVKAYVHGHIHHRNYFEHQGIHILNTPAISYVANPKKSTTGWTTARLTPDQGTFTTWTNDPQHDWNGETKVLKWRG